MQPTQKPILLASNGLRLPDMLPVGPIPLYSAELSRLREICDHTPAHRCASGCQSTEVSVVLIKPTADRFLYFHSAALLSP